MVTGVAVTLKTSVGRSILKMAKSAGFNTIRIDMDYSTVKQYQVALKKEEKNDFLIILESPHGLGNEMHTFEPGCPTIHNFPGTYYLIIYMLPPLRKHIKLWLNRTWEWFCNGTVDITRGNHRPYSLRNVPLIVKEVTKQLVNRRRWIKEDLKRIKQIRNLGKTVVIAQGVEEATTHFISWLESQHP